MKVHILRPGLSPRQTHHSILPLLLPWGVTVRTVSLVVTNISITLSKGENAQLPQECVGRALQVAG